MPPALFRIAALSLLSVLSALPVQAQNVCTAIETADGFVALRDRPSSKGKLVVRMNAWERLQVRIAASLRR